MTRLRACILLGKTPHAGALRCARARARAAGAGARPAKRGDGGGTGAERALRDPRSRSATARVADRRSAAAATAAMRCGHRLDDIGEIASMNIARPERLRNRAGDAGGSLRARIGSRRR